MPFVIGVLGVGGPTKDYESPRYQGVHQYFRDAMAAPASMPEFSGNVAAVRTELFWDKPLAAVESKRGKPRALSNLLRNGNSPGDVVATRYPLAYSLRKEYWDTPPADRKMTKEEQEAYVDEYRAKLISPEDEAMWQRGASNGGYHYLGCAKTLALIGKAFAEALREMETKR
jgi:alpha-galactosidase